MTPLELRCVCIHKYIQSNLIWVEYHHITPSLTVSSCVAAVSRGACLALRHFLILESSPKESDQALILIISS